MARGIYNKAGYKIVYMYYKFLNFYFIFNIMKTINVILEGENYKAIQVTRGNLGEVEWFTDGEIKCQTESFTQSGKCEVWCYKGGGVFWVTEGGYFLKNTKGDLDMLTKMQFEALPTIEIPKEITIWEKLLNLFNARR